MKEKGLYEMPINPIFAYGGNPYYRRVTNFAKCRYCGSERVAWFKTPKGKWVLLEGYRDHTNGELYILTNGYHKCNSSARNPILDELIEKSPYRF